MTLEISGRLLTDALAAESGLVMVLTGAGVSLASGIPTFRGSDDGAVWARDVTELGTYRYFQGNPVRSWQWYRQRFASATRARPNAAHIALAALEQWQISRGGRFLLVTQNIDTLHEQAGSVDLVKVHGSADRARCSRPGCVLASTQTTALADLDFAEFERNPRVRTIPHCPECDGLMRPHVLWFDEVYTDHADYGWTKVVEACDHASFVAAVGTSFSVGVTDLIQEAASSRGVPMFIVDPGAHCAPARGTLVHLKEKAEALLPMVVDTLMQHSRKRKDAD